MDYRLESSLADQASVAIVSSMWCRQIYLNRNWYNGIMSIQTRFAWLLSDCGDNIWWHLNELSIPSTIKQHLMNIFSPIGHQILLWLESNLFLKLYENPFSDLLVWSPQGTLDTKATAENILQNKNHSPMDRFRIACNNCIYDEIIQLWPEVQHHFNDLDWKEYLTNMEVKFWVYYIKDEIIKLMDSLSFTGTSTELALWVAVESDNYVFAKYFMEQLEPHKLKEAINDLYSSFIRKHVKKNTSFGIYCLSHLNHQEQMDIFVKNPRKNLFLFLYWPLQNYFIELASKLWYFLEPIDSYLILEELIRHESLSHWGNMYKNLFKEFWNSAPIQHRNYVINKILKTPFLSRMYSIAHSGSLILFLLEEISHTRKLKMMTDFNGCQLISSLLIQMEWDSLELLIESCVTTCEDIDALDIRYTEYLKQPPPYIKITKNHLIELNRILKKISEKLKLKHIK